MTRKLTVRARIFCVIALMISSTVSVMAQNPVPFLSQPLVPDAVAPAPGGPGFTFALTVNGTGFVPGSTVNWNGSPRFTTFVNNSRLIAFILSLDIIVPTTAWITVVNPAVLRTLCSCLLTIRLPRSRLAGPIMLSAWTLSL